MIKRCKWQWLGKAGGFCHWLSLAHHPLPMRVTLLVVSSFMRWLHPSIHYLERGYT